MASTIKLKNGSGAPTAGDLVQGEPALDLTNKRLYTEDAGGNVIEIGTSPSTIDINAGTIDGVTLGTNSAVTEAQIDNININGNAIISTDTNGNIAITPNGTGEVDISKVDINGGTIDGVTIGGASAGAGTFTTLTTGSTVTLNGGTANGVLYLNGSKVATSGSALTFDGTNLGVGGSASGAKLHVLSTGSVGTKVENTGGTGAAFAQLKNTAGSTFLGQDSTGGYLLTDYAAPLLFYINNSEQMRLTSTGLGIGTSSPKIQEWRAGTYLTVANASTRGQVEIDGAVADSGSASLGALIFTYSTNTTNHKDVALIEAISSGVTANQRGGVLNFYTKANGTASPALNMTLDASGNLGLGVTPSAWDTYRVLEAGVAGSAFVSNAGSSQVGIVRNGYWASGGWKYAGTGTATLQLQQNGEHQFWNAGSGTAGNAITFTQAMTLNASGNLLVGKTSSGNINVMGAELNSSGYGMFSVDGERSLYVNRDSSDGAIIDIRKDGSQVGSIGTNGTLYVSSSQAGGLRFNYYDATNATIHPCTTTGAVADNLHDLGLSSARFDDIYATNALIQTSDRNEKQDIEALSEAEQRVAVAAKGLLRKFRWKSKVAEKGDDARIHFGIIAQDLQAAFEAEGLDAGRYAMFIHSTWTDEETGEERSRMGVRYSELLAFIIAAI